MIEPKEFFNALVKRGIDLFTGVPDSLLASFCSYVDDHGRDCNHIIAANEGNAVAIAVGYHISCGKIGAVYLQNSGLGNAVNPLTSLAVNEVYRIPVLLIIGWRGEPGIKDEPQHIKQGQITLAQLDLLDIPYKILDPTSNLNNTLDGLFKELCSLNTPVALVIRRDTFSEYKSIRKHSELSKLTREEALCCILNLVGKQDLLISTTGKTSRELFELRKLRGELQRDFLTVGGMGHTSSIALGVAMGRPKRRVICLDGDGSMLMHFGALPVIAGIKPSNLIHIILNNGAHESVGGQPTVAGKMDIEAIARSSGYVDYQQAVDLFSIEQAWNKISGKPGPVLIEICIKLGSRDNLGRPTSTAEENKQAFMNAANE